MNMTGYVFANICIFLLGILYEGITLSLAIQEVSWKMELESSSYKGSPTSLNFTKKEDKRKLLLSINLLKYIGGYGDGWLGVRISISRSIYRFFATAFSYSLMLIAMTFNVGFFISVCAGIAFGSFLFTPISSKVLGSKPDIIFNTGCC
jgi:ABC-type dipeptide/oligopeptide/nickel transport system permease component